MNVVQAIDFLDEPNKSSRTSIKHLISSTMYDPTHPNLPTIPLVYLDDIEDGGKHSKCLDLLTKIKIGRSTSSRTQFSKSNGFFDSKVLSRAHAEISFDHNNMNFYIQDLGSSNGTYINNRRISEESKISELCKITNGDKIDFGVDILNDNQTDVLYKKVTLTVRIVPRDDSQMARNHAFTEDHSHQAMQGETLTNTMRLNVTRNDPSTKINETVAKEMAVLVGTLQTQLHKSKKQNTYLNQLRTELVDVQNMTNASVINSARQQDDSKRNFDQLVHELNSLKSNNLNLQSQLTALNSDKSKINQELDATKAQLHKLLNNSSASSPELESLRNDKLALQTKIRDLESKLVRASSSNPVGATRVPPSVVNTHSPSSNQAIPTWFLFVIAVGMAFYVYIEYFNGLDVLDPLSQQYLNYNLSDAYRLVSTEAGVIYQKTSRSVAKLFKEGVQEEL